MAFKEQQGRPERESSLSVPASLRAPKEGYPSWFLSLSAMRQSERKELSVFLSYLLTLHFVIGNVVEPSLIMGDDQNNQQSASGIRTMNSSLHMYMFFWCPTWLCAP